MRTQSFTKEIRRFYDTINHALHDRAHPTPARVTTWRRVELSGGAHTRMTLRGVMQPHPIAVRTGSHLDHALQLMIAHGINGLPVVDAEGRIAGIITERDALKIFYEPDATEVEAVMSREPAVVSIDAPLVDVLDQLMTADFGRVLVHENGRLVGAVTRARLIPKVLQSLREDVFARREKARRSH